LEFEEEKPQEESASTEEETGSAGRRRPSRIAIHMGKRQERLGNRKSVSYGLT